MKQNTDNQWSFSESANDIDVLLFAPGAQLPTFVSGDSELNFPYRNKEERLQQAAYIAKAVNNHEAMLEALKGLLNVAETWANGVQYPTITAVKQVIVNAEK